MKNLKLRQNRKLFSSNCGRLVVGMVLASLIGLGGCGAKETKAPADENLIKARETVRHYWSAIVSKDYQQAAKYTEAALFPDRQAELIAKLKKGYEPLGITEIIAVDKAYYDPKVKGHILVPYRVKAKQDIAEKAILRSEDPKQGWLITGGI